nr:hypothetical protein [Thermoanaerobacterium thermosaccharolyticum]
MDSKLSNTDREKAVLVGVIINDDDDSESMEELKELAKTAGADV